MNEMEAALAGCRNEINTLRNGLAAEFAKNAEALSMLDEAKMKLAAVPALLEALEFVMAETFDVAVNGHVDNALVITREQAGRIYEVARSAITKARR